MAHKSGERIEYIVNWLRNYAADAGAKGFVVGISGGVDSAVCSALCARTGLPVECVELPIHSFPDQVSRGRVHIERLMGNFPNVHTAKHDLTAAYDIFLSSAPAGTGDKESLTLSRANLRSRLRMSALYFRAGQSGKLVAGTGNKIEDFGVGFFTKYGDGGVDLSPLGDLYKSEVYALAQALDVPESILTAAPTDGLWQDDRSDEDQLGATYPELEWAMKEAERGFKAEHFTGREREVMEIYQLRNRANQHKIKPIPVCEIPDSLR